MGYMIYYFEVVSKCLFLNIMEWVNEISYYIIIDYFKGYGYSYN